MALILAQKKEIFNDPNRNNYQSVYIWYQIKIPLSYINILEQKDKYMGCTESTNVHTPLLHTNFNKKLSAAIEADDVAALAELQAKEDFPANLELSDNGELWTGIHFCCRFDSPCCLDFLLKKAYLQNVKQFIHFVNLQTAEGLTCLHLCAASASFKCFALLLRYGALNLSLLDSKHRTAEMIMKGNGLTEMQEITAKLKDREGLITGWNYQLLQQNLDVTKLRSAEFHKQQISKILNKEKVIETATFLSQHEKQAKLWEQKGKLQKESDEIYSQIKEKLQKLEKEKESLLNEPKKNGRSLPSQESIPKSEEIQTLQIRLKEKEKQIQRMKQEIREAKSLVIDGILQLQNNKIDLENQQTKEAFSQFAAQFSSFKQQLIANKAKYVPTPKVLVPIKEYRKGKQVKGGQSDYCLLVRPGGPQFESDPNFIALPQNIKEKYKRAKQKGSFIDEQFPPNELAFGAKYYPKRFQQFSQMVWLRPTQFMSPNFVLFDGIEPDDVKQGELADCYFLAIISQLARQPQRVRNLFAFYDTQIGFYVVKFYSNGKLDYIVLDDYFPCRTTDKKPLFCLAVGYEIWVLLLQKAWAKHIGSYINTQGLEEWPVIDDFTASPTLVHYFAHKTTNKTLDLTTYTAKGKLTVLGSSKNVNLKGIVACHAYSLLKLIQHNGQYIYKIRNPWGSFEWVGSYGDQSTLWTPQLRKKCEQKNGDDGVFFMSERELVEAFENYTIQLGQANAKYTYLGFNSQPEQALYFRFKLTKKGMMAVKITQIYSIMLKEIDKQYKYSPVIFELGKIVNNGVTFLSQGAGTCYRGGKSVYISKQMYAQYEAGDYFVRVVMQWANPKKYNTAVFGVYCKQTVTIQKIQPAEGLALWKKMICNFMEGKELTTLNKNISYTMEWMKGQIVCYSSINPNAQADAFKVRFTFDSKTFENCKLSFNKLNQNIIEFVVDKKEKNNFGTVYIKNIANDASQGKYSVDSFDKQNIYENPISPPIQPQNQQINKQANKLPENIKAIYKNAKGKGSFKDEQFPTQHSSLGGQEYQENIKPFLKTLVWLRPNQFITNFSLFDSISPDDVKQGQVDNSYVLAALANYARNPQKITDAFTFYDIQLGFYVLRFYTNGKPSFVVVDDYIPCNSTTKKPFFAFPVGNKLWVLLIEKAWAKVFGSYFAGQSETADPFMEDFTGSPAYGTWFSGEENKTDKLVSHSLQNYSIVLRTEESQIKSIVSHHDYSLLKVIQHKGANIYKVRNPWGNFQWNGEYGEQSSLWTPQLRKKCDQKNGDDGVFFLSESELLKALPYYSVGLDEPNAKYSYAEFQSKPEQSVYFRFRLAKKVRAAIKITQPFEALVADEDYEYSSAVFELGKVQNNSVTFISEGSNDCYNGNKSMWVTDDIFEEYQAGEYFVRIKMIWTNPKKYNAAVLSVYCGESTNIERVKEAEGFKLWRQMVHSFMQDAQLNAIDENVLWAQEWMRGQLICYAVVKDNGKAGNYRVRWAFDSSNFVNCRTEVGKVNESEIGFFIDKREGFNFGTINCIDLSEQCNQGDCGCVVAELL